MLCRHDVEIDAHNEKEAQKLAKNADAGVRLVFKIQPASAPLQAQSVRFRDDTMRSFGEAVQERINLMCREKLPAVSGLINGDVVKRREDQSVLRKRLTDLFRAPKGGPRAQVAFGIFSATPSHYYLLFQY